MHYPYAIMDVFTRTPLQGNPLAIVGQAEGLPDKQMQAIAREFNLSETVFVCPASQGQYTAALRIFTPNRELPFAGHPTIGTACYLALQSSKPGGQTQHIAFEEKVGLVACEAKVQDQRTAFARFKAPRLPEQSPAHEDSSLYAPALGLEPADIGFAAHRPTRFSAGVPFTFVPIASLEAIGRARPVSAAWAQAFGKEGDAYLYCPQTRDPAHAYHARMFAPSMGIGEDPATGAAAVAFAGVISLYDRPSNANANRRLILEQGFEMGRPSLIELGLAYERAVLQNITIAGEAVMLAQGALDI